MNSLKKILYEQCLLMTSGGLRGQVAAIIRVLHGGRRLLLPVQSTLEACEVCLVFIPGTIMAKGNGA